MLKNFLYITTLIFSFLLFTFLFSKKNTDFLKVQATTVTYTTNGSWQAPAGVTSVIVELWGGGGGGGDGGGSHNDGGGGGAGGQYSKKVVTVTSGNFYSYTIGSAGSAGVDTNGGPGGDSTFDTNVVVAKGGAGGLSYDNGQTGALGSTTNGVGDIVYAGGNGADGTLSYSGGGGGGAGSTGTGNSANADTAGTAKTENGGAGGNGSTARSGNGSAGNTYGGGGGAGTRNGSGAAGAPGYIRLTYTVANTSPTFTIVTSDDPDPVDIGSNVTFSATATDTSDNWYLAVCKTNEINPGTPPTCATSQTYCVSSSAVASATENTCSWTSDNIGDNDWFSFACDNNASPACSSANITNSPIAVSAVYSVSISPGGTITYGTVETGQTKSTIDVTQSQVVTNDGTNSGSKINIKTSNATNGTTWTLGSSAGSNIFVHEISPNSGVGWTQLDTTDIYQTLNPNLAQDGTQDLDLRITIPTSSDAVQKSITVTLQAVAP